MEIQIRLTEEDMRRLIAQHVHKEFGIDVHNIEFENFKAAGEPFYLIKVGGKYIGKA